MIGNDSLDFAPHAGPGHWNVCCIIHYYHNIIILILYLFKKNHFKDPDMLIIGNFGLSLDQSKAQMAVVRNLFLKFLYTFIY